MKPTIRRIAIECASMMAVAAFLSPMAGCDREVTTEKESSSRVVDTPEGPKKVTETTETTTVKEKKD